MLIIPFLILLLFFGLLVTIAFKVKVGLAERLSISYLLGIGLFTFFVFAFDLVFNINYSLNNTFSLLVSLCVILFATKYKDVIKFFKGIKFEKKKPKMVTILFWSIILSIVTYTLVSNIYWPVFDWDALALYDFRARVFMIDRNLIHAALSNSYFLGYPLFTSLAHLFVYQIGMQSPKFIYSLFYLSFIVIFYFSLKRNVSEKKAIFFTLIFTFVPEIFSHSMMAYTNLAYAVYLVTGTLYLYIWIKSKENTDLLISAILVGLSTWVRISEPFWIIPLIVVIFTSFKNKKFSSLLYYLAPILLIRTVWKYFGVYIYDRLLHNQTIAGLTYAQILKDITPDRVLSTLNYLFKYVFSTWGLLLLIFVLSCLKIVLLKNLNKSIFLTITALFFGMLFVGTLVFTITYSGWQDIFDSARRMSIFILPLSIYSIALITNNEN